MIPTRLQLRRVAIAAVATSALLACSSAGEPTAPGDPAANATPVSSLSFTHPQGVLSDKVLTFTGRPFGIDVSPAGLLLATEQDANDVAGFFASNTALPITPYPVTADPGDVIFNASGTRAYASTFYGGKVHVINTEKGFATDTIPIGANAYRLALSNDGTRLFVTSVYGGLYSVKLIPGYPTTSINLGASLQGIALSPDGKSLFVSSTSGSIWRIDPVTLQVQASGAVGGMLQELLISPDGTELYAANEQGGVIVVDASTLAATGSFAVPYGVFGMALSPDGKRLYAASANAGTLTIAERFSRKVVSTLTLGGTPRRIAFDATGATAYVANEGNWVDIIK